MRSCRLTTAWLLALGALGVSFVFSPSLTAQQRSTWWSAAKSKPAMDSAFARRHEELRLPPTRADDPPVVERIYVGLLVGVAGGFAGAYLAGWLGPGDNRILPAYVGGVVGAVGGIALGYWVAGRILPDDDAEPPPALTLAIDLLNLPG